LQQKLVKSACGCDPAELPFVAPETEIRVDVADMAEALAGHHRSGAERAGLLA
jgi:hypothetical protein